MTKREFAIMRRIAEKRFGEESAKRREAADKADTEELERLVKTDKDFQKARELWKGLEELAKKFEKRGLKLTHDGYYRWKDGVELDRKDVGPAKAVYWAWAKKVAKEMEDALDRAELASAGIEAEKLLAEIEKLFK